MVSVLQQTHKFSSNNAFLESLTIAEAIRPLPIPIYLLFLLASSVIVLALLNCYFYSSFFRIIKPELQLNKERITLHRNKNYRNLAKPAVMS